MSERKTVAQSIVELVQENANLINKEDYAKIELVIQAGKLDGMRVSKYIKAKNN